MEYQRAELTEWYDKEGRVRQRRLRSDRFVLSAWALNKVCNSLVGISDGAAKAIVAEEFGKLGKFEARGIEEKPRIIRYAVPKHAIDALISRYSNMRRQHVPQLVNDATELIRSCDQVELDHGRVFSHYFAFIWPQIIDHDILPRINGPAIKLYLWLLVRQEEAARKNQWGLDLTDAEIGRQWDVTRKAIGRLRQELQELGLLKIKGRKWTVGY